MLLEGAQQVRADRHELVGAQLGLHGPGGVKVDSNNVVTEGTFLNSQFFLEARPYEENVEVLNLNPGGFSWQINDWLLVDGQVNLSRGVLPRSADRAVQQPAEHGLTVDLHNTGGDMPTITPARA
jgi:hypothetical protein